MVSFGGNTSASQRFQRQMGRSDPYDLDKTRAANSIQQEQSKTTDGLVYGSQRAGNAPYQSNPVFESGGSPSYVPSQFQSINHVEKSGSFRHQNRNLVSNTEQPTGPQRPNMINASVQKKISN